MTKRPAPRTLKDGAGQVKDFLLARFFATSARPAAPRDMHHLAASLVAAAFLLPAGLATADSAVTAAADSAAAAPKAAPSAAPSATAAAVTTQACLGDFTAFLTCPAGAAVAGTECRQREPNRGNGPGEHWSGSQRQGPALFLRGRAGVDAPPGKTAIVSFAARYKNHKKTGRLFRFDKEGRLSSWGNLIGDRSYGLSVSCSPEGKVVHVATYFDDKVVGLSRSWRKDGTLSYAIARDATGSVSKQEVEPTAELARRPDELCRPARCDINAAPDVSALPQGMSLPVTP